METYKVVGLLFVGVLFLLPLYNAIRVHYKDKRQEDKERDLRYYEQRERQIEASHEQTIATNNLTNEMKIMRKEVTDLENRTHQLEVVVFKKDRI